MAHTGFPIHIPEGFLKGTQSPSSEFQRRTACPPSQTVCSGDTPRPVLRSRDTPGRKQNNRMAPDQTSFFPSKANSEFHNDNERHYIYSTYVAYKVRTIRIFSGPAQTCFHKGHYRSEHNFSSEADGQKQDTLVLSPLLESNCLSLMFH